MADENIKKALEDNIARAARIEVKTEDIFSLLTDNDPDRGPNPLEAMLEQILVAQMRQHQDHVAIAGTLRGMKQDLEQIQADLAAVRASK